MTYLCTYSALIPFSNQDSLRSCQTRITFSKTSPASPRLFNFLVCGLIILGFRFRDRRSLLCCLSLRRRRATESQQNKQARYKPSQCSCSKTERPRGLADYGSPLTSLQK